ncbi:MAG: urea carboxylase-associated family protein [Gammaproteobacteria bacterium]|nr:urea carboxylase-associated family protein [Gammaproteobacteria bacterium]
MSSYIQTPHYTTTLPPNSHWSLRARRGTYLRITDIAGDGNLGMLLYNPQCLLERYNAPDTLKCQHTFKLTAGHCLYSDMGRIFASIVEDSLGWHETVCGNLRAEQVAQRWGARNYQRDRNQWQQNGHDAFLVELAKYGLTERDMAANINWFSKVCASGEDGSIARASGHSQPGDSVLLRFDMDTLVIMHSCPHPHDHCAEYPLHEFSIEMGTALPVAEDDPCKNHCQENQRGFANNALYNLGHETTALAGDDNRSAG